MSIYSSIVRPLLFSLDPERVHELTLRAGQGVFGISPLRDVARAATFHTSPRLETAVLGVRFPNRVGLAAGFDKNATALDFFTGLGFGHLEIGTVTAKPQPGNQKPRIFRLSAEQALINRMGFPSDGARAVAARLEKFIASGRKRIPIGINIGKTKIVPVEEAVRDYEESFLVLRDLGDYFAVNVSSPNTPDLRKLQERSRLTALLTRLQELNIGNRPLFVKVAPDLSNHELEDVVAAALDARFAGIIATNTTLARPAAAAAAQEAGGLSGRPLHPRSLQVVRFLSELSAGRLVIIGVGGIVDESTAIQTLNAGAALIQVYTGLVYAGPFLISRINRAYETFLEGFNPSK